MEEERENKGRGGEKGLTEGGKKKMEGKGKV